jgi:hypothetical protein
MGKIVLCAAALLLAALGAVASTPLEATNPPAKFKVDSLPGYVNPDGTPKRLPSSWYTGYIDAGTPPSGEGTMYFHYFMIESERDPANDPVLFWYNGGPGASSLFGMLQEWGPLRLNELSYDKGYNRTGIPTPVYNAFRWTQTHTIVAIDSPPPIGLSFCSAAGPGGAATSCGPWKDTDVFKANHEAHRTFFVDIFPELKGNPVYFTGESYAGIYVPGFAMEMLNDPIDGVNFQGIAVGDGWTGCKQIEGKPVDWCIDLDNVGIFKYPNVHPGPFYDVEFFHGHSQFSNELYNQIQATCSDAELKGTEKMLPSCSALISEMSDEIGYWFPYNLYNACPSGAMMLDRHGMNRALKYRRQSLKAIFKKGNVGGVSPGEGDSGLGSPCLAGAMNEWFALPETLKAVGALPGSKFLNLDNGHGFNYSSNQPFVGDIYAKLIKAGKRVMIYEGDTDACGLQTSPVEDVFVELFKSLGLKKTQKWRPWTTNGEQQMGGYTIEWNGGDIRFVSIRGSGHLAPLNRPHVTQKMMAEFVSGKSLPPFLPPTETAKLAL